MAVVGGVLSGMNPFHYNSSSPLTLFLFQTCLILATCNLIHIPFSMIRQPKVISEVIAGVILGPTVFGQIPNYTETVFPASSIPGLNLTANLGIILFMFFLGLEVDLPFIKKHLKTALSIGITTLAVPFGCGCLLAIPLFHNYANKDPDARIIKFTVFMIFIAVSIAVTAFPVLCRILNELRLIKDRAGVVVLGAGIINDILGWILLALSVILSSSNSDPLNTVYILLCTLGWFLVYFYPIRFILKWGLVKTHELERTKPSPLATMCILFVMFISAYFTDIIGVHPIFGAFIAGLIVPRENQYVVKLTERMEDIPNIVLIPIYFAVAGLNVDLTLLNEGKDWGFVFASIAIAIASKIISGSLMGKLHGLFWRESLAVGILMSCKGIVEIVVLTVGLNAGIISRKIFGMFILMALVSTFVTTPLTIVAYPNSYRAELQKWLDKPDAETDTHSSATEFIKMQDYTNQLTTFSDLLKFRFSEIVNIVNTTEGVSPSLELINYLNLGKQPPRVEPVHHEEASKESTSSSFKTTSKFKTLAKHFSRQTDDTGLTCIEEAPSGFEYCIPLKTVHIRLLTERTTDLLRSSTMYDDDPHFVANCDSLLQIFAIFAKLSKVPFSSEVIFSTIREKAVNIRSMDFYDSDFVLLPLKGSTYELRGSSVLVDDKYKSFENFYSHLLGLNELPSGFFSQLCSLRASIGVLISNTGGRLNADKFKCKSFNLLLPSPNLSSSDFLGVYILLLIKHRSVKNRDNVNCTIFTNEKNTSFLGNLCTQLADQSWFHPSDISFVSVSTEEKTENSVEFSPFIESILSKGLSEEAIENLEETTFIVPEPFFEASATFTDDVKAVVLKGANRKFNVLITHYSTSITGT